VETYEGKTPPIGDHQARELLNAPNAGALKGKRDRAIPYALFYHGLRCEEPRRLKVRDIAERRIYGSMAKAASCATYHFIQATAELILEYLEALGHGGMCSSPLFRLVRNNMTGRTD